MIPRSIVQTWKSAALPPKARALQASWTRCHPAFAYRLYDDAAAEAVVAEVAPAQLALYRALPFPVMRADVFRYAVIYRDGGIYADIDMECLRPLDRLLALAPALFSVEAILSARRQAAFGYREPFQVANCIFAAEPRHPFMRAALERSFALAQEARDIARDRVEDITGPRMLTRLYFERDWRDVALLHQVYLTPPRHYPAIGPLASRIHARHHFFGSWKARAPARSPVRVFLDRDLQPNPLPRQPLFRGAAPGAR